MNKKNEVITGAIMMAVVTIVMFLPGLVSAGSLEPTAAPGSTMKTLDQIPPNWSQKISGAARFELVLDGAGVLDKETGLVWEQSPTNTMPQTWIDASSACYTNIVGGRNGWHLPTIEQLTSLLDTSVAGPLKLPAGHPFSGVASVFYWSATPYAGSTASAWNVNFSGGVLSFDKTNTNFVWCVRGGQGYDGQ